MRKDLIYDWGQHAPKDESIFYKLFKRNKRKVELNDETLRDGLQGTYVQHPSLQQKKRFLDVIEELGINSANIGFPVSGISHKKDVIELINYSRQNKLRLALECGARIVRKDVEEVIEVSQKTSYQLEVGIFIGSSKIRHLVEKWDLHEMRKQIKEAVSLGVKNNLKVMFVTEDTTRAHPETIYSLYKEAIDSGAERICISDTVGYATPWSTMNLFAFLHEKIIGKDTNVKIDWHGHNDRGLAIANSLIAAKVGADRIQATALGVGERAGNASMIELMINLQIEGLISNDLKFLNEYAKQAGKMLKVRVLPNSPVIGSDVFKTATGIHAAAINKAIGMNDDTLSGIIYSAFDPKTVGRTSDILIGPMSGKANVLYRLKKLNLPATDEIIQSILKIAKEERRIIQDIELINLNKD